MNTTAAVETEMFEGHKIALASIKDGGVLHGFIDGVDQGRVPNMTGAAISRMRTRIREGNFKTVSA